MCEGHFSLTASLRDKVAVVTGGGGVLCRALSLALAEQHMKLAVLDLRADAAERVADEIDKNGGVALPIACNVLERPSLESARKRILEELGGIDLLINGAGGNSPDATTSNERLTAEDLAQPPEGLKTFFDLEPDALRFVFDLNFLGTFLPSQIFGRAMAEAGGGVILNVSSMNAFRPLTKIPGYSAAKAAVSNFTQWLAVHMAPMKIRVNALAPGFFLTDQNRFLLTDEKTGELTPRGRTILDHTPMGRFGDPEDLVGTLLWLASDASEFVTGVVVPVDGGFSAFSGV
jgi:NAD(P)-dependent dehydrogenase (short-subunit alcohol dehydrogenase family)